MARPGCQSPTADIQVFCPQAGKRLPDPFQEVSSNWIRITTIFVPATPHTGLSDDDRVNWFEGSNGDTR